MSLAISFQTLFASLSICCYAVYKSLYFVWEICTVSGVVSRCLRYGVCCIEYFSWDVMNCSE